jgi:hypothetical protein
MTALVVALAVTGVAIAAVARWQKARKDGRPFLPRLRHGAHRATRDAQDAEDERFWAYQATIAKKETWDRPPADLFPELHHEPSGAGMVSGESPGRLSLGHETPAPEPLPPAERAWPTHKLPLTGDICELPHPGRVPVAALGVALALGHLIDTVKEEATTAYLAERPELVPGQGYSDAEGTLAAICDGPEDGAS